MGGTWSSTAPSTSSTTATPLDDASKSFFQSLTSVQSLPNPCENLNIWLELLNFKFTIGRQLTMKEVEFKGEPLLRNLERNTSLSDNRNQLFRLLIILLNDYSIANRSRDAIILNCIFIARISAKYLIETRDFEELLKFFNSPSNHQQKNEQNINQSVMIGNRKLIRTRLGVSLLNSLLSFLVDVPVNDSNQFIHAEVCILLTTLLASDTFSVNSSPFADEYYSMKSKNAIRLIKVLFLDFISESKSNKSSSIDSWGNKNQFTDSALKAVDYAFSAWNGSNENDSIFNDFQRCSLNRSACLLLLVSCRYLRGNDVLRDASSVLSDETSSSSSSNDLAATTTRRSRRSRNALRRIFHQHHFESLWRPLFDTLIERAIDPPTLLLLYALLQNQHFREHALACVDMQRMIEPLLRLLYNSLESIHYQQYLILSIFVILSSHASFGLAIKQIKLDKIVWNKKIELKDISLSSLLIYTIVHALRRNLSSLRDEQIHDMCRAVIGNLSNNCIDDIHAIVAEHIAELFEFVTRKYIANVEGGGETLCVYQDVLVSVLSLVDALLYDTPTHCPAMIYAMLSKRELVSALVSYSKLKSSARNVERVLTHFGAVVRRECQVSESVSDVELVQSVPAVRAASAVVDECSRAFRSKSGASTALLTRAAVSPHTGASWTFTEQRPEVFSALVWRVVHECGAAAWCSKHLINRHETLISSDTITQ